MLSNYWQRVAYGRLSRRNALRGAAVGLAGVAGAALIGCGDDDEEAAPAAATAAPSGGTATQTATAAPTEAAPQIKQGGILQSSATSSPVHFDQHQLPGISGSVAYNQLLKLHREQGVIPDLAEDWQSPEETVFIFKLRPGVKFHDKPPVDARELVAEDVVYSIERSRTDDPNFTNRWMWTELVGLEAVDDSTVRFEFSQPFAPALYHIAATSMGVIARETVEEFGDLKDWKSRIGTGPFTYEEFRRDDIIEIRRNPDYFESGMPHMDGIDYPVIPDRASRIVAFRSGQIDILSGSGLSDKDEPGRGMGDKVVTHIRPSDAPTVVGVNHAVPELSDWRVRKALSLAIDRDEVIQASGGDDAGLIVGMTHPHSYPWGLSEDELKEITKPDLARAKELMAAAAYADGIEISITVSSSNPVGMDIAALMQQQVARIGVDLTVDPQEGGTYIRKLIGSKGGKRSFDLILVTGWTPALDPGQQYHGSLIAGAAQNWWNSDVPEINELDVKQVRELDMETRQQLIQEIERVNFEKVAAMPLYAVNGWLALKSFIKNWNPRSAANSGDWENGINAWLDT